MGLPVFPEFDNEALLGLPSVLARSSDPGDRLSRVKALDELLRWHLDRYPDDALKDVAWILFGTATGNRRQPIGKRREAAAVLLSVDPEHVRTGIQRKILKGIAWELHRDSQESLQRTHKPADHDLDLPATPSGQSTVGALRQLYRYAQETVLLVEAHDQLCERKRSLTDRGNKYALQIESFPISYRLYADTALWAYAYFRLYFGRVMSDPSGREFLREHLSMEWWRYTRARACLNEDQARRLVDELAELERDEPLELSGNLHRDPLGEAIHTRWLSLMSTIDSGGASDASGQIAVSWTHRDQLIRDLLALCAQLQLAFPETTLDASHAEARFESAITCMGAAGLLECHVSRDDADGEAAFALMEKTFEGRPRRYRRGVAERVCWPASKWE